VRWRFRGNIRDIVSDRTGDRGGSGFSGAPPPEERKVKIAFRPAAQPESSACGRCGVAVSPGYPRCPKCGSVLPGAPSPAWRAPNASGGTSAAGRRSLPGPLLWGAAAVGALALVAIAVSVRGGDDRTAAASASDASPSEANEPVVGAAFDEAGEAFALDESDEVVDADEATEAALESLLAALREERLWSLADLEPDDRTVIRLESAHCDDPLLGQLVGRMSRSLRTVGLRSVHCYARHGGLVFERPLQ